MCGRDSQFHDLSRIEMDIEEIPKSADNEVSKKASIMGAFFFFSHPEK